MIRLSYCLAVISLISTPLMAQQNFASVPTASNSSAVQTTRPTNPANTSLDTSKPFSRLALGGGISTLGINLQAATNINRYANLRVSGNIFSHTVNDISSNGFTANAKLDLATLGASVDYYPWPTHGFRVSPGLLLYNQNSMSADAIVYGGQSFKLNDVEYYSSANDPIHADPKIGFHSTNPAFTLTTGWGNMISRKGGHWSFPFEIGAAFIGDPSFNMSLTGTACDYYGENCVDAGTDPSVQADLQAQNAKYRKDLQPLRFFPILSTGISYNFNILRTR